MSAAKGTQMSDYEVAVDNLDRAVEAIAFARDYLFAVDDAPSRVRAWLDAERTKLPGLTNSEVALIERLIEDLEAR